jgi:quercetin dioxygenase-like cupin family protein
VPETYMKSVDEAPSVDLQGKVIAGKLNTGPAVSTLTTLGSGAMLTHVVLKEGFDQAAHRHPDHESLAYVMSGRIEMRIGDATSILGSGSTWYHPRGVEHTCRVIEEATVLEFHTPLRNDLLELFGRS